MALEKYNTYRQKFKLYVLFIINNYCKIEGPCILVELKHINPNYVECVKQRLIIRELDCRKYTTNNQTC